MAAGLLVWLCALFAFFASFAVYPTEEAEAVRVPSPRSADDDLPSHRHVVSTLGVVSREDERERKAGDQDSVHAAPGTPSTDPSNSASLQLEGSVSPGADEDAEERGAEQPAEVAVHHLSLTDVDHPHMNRIGLVSYASFQSSLTFL